MLYKKNRSRIILHFLSAPFILGMIIPFIFLDICLEVYHRISFPLYGLKYIERHKYIRVFDRLELHYIRVWDKIFCAYCGYANGLIRYTQAVAARTEEYWCGIKHVNDGKFIASDFHKSFLEHGDEDQFCNFIGKKEC